LVLHSHSRAPGGLIQIDFALQPGLLNEHGHAGLLDFEEIAIDLPQARFGPTSE
jgi:hypothetical protein